MSLFPDELKALEQTDPMDRIGEYDGFFEPNKMQMVYEYSVNNFVDPTLRDGGLADWYGRYGELKSLYDFPGMTSNGKVVAGFLKKIASTPQQMGNLIAENPTMQTVAVGGDIIKTLANPYKDFQNETGMLSALDNFVVNQPIASRLDQMLPDEYLGPAGSFGELLAWGAGFSKSYNWMANKVKGKLATIMASDVVANTLLSEKGEENWANMIQNFFGYDEKESRNMALKGLDYIAADKDDSQLALGLKSSSMDWILIGTGKKLYDLFKMQKALFKRPETSQDLVDASLSTDIKFKEPQGTE